MKQQDDTLTFDMLGAAKQGRRPKFDRPMTAAERQARVRAARLVREEATRDNMRYIVNEVQRLRHALAEPGQDLADLQETCKGIKDAAIGTLAILGLLEPHD